MNEFLAGLVVAVLAGLGALVAKLIGRRRLAGRAAMEDGLKHLFDRGYRGQTATPGSLAGATGLGLKEAVSLIERVQREGYARPEAGGFVLTKEGEAAALPVVRAHRLYETHLARETGLDAAEWHEMAERAEHELTKLEVDALADRLGRPRFDPHGDPIPTRSGGVPPAMGTALLEWAQGVDARIVHIEDEPKEIYAAIVRLGLAPGMALCIEGRTRDAIELRMEGGRLHLPVSLAGNVMVLAAVAGVDETAGIARLAVLGPGEGATIAGLSPACQGAERSRLLDLGLVPGTPIQRDLTGAFGSPIAYRVRGTLIALRREQAGKVLIHAVPAGEAIASP